LEFAGEIPASAFSVHQGEWERDLARDAYLDAGVKIISENRVEQSDFAPLWPGEHPIFIFRGQFAK
jgi:hypothetical protein